MLKVYGRSTSDNVQKVLWMAGETGQAFEHIPAGGSFGGLDSREYREMNPHGRIPTIDDDGVVVWVIGRTQPSDPNAPTRTDPWRFSDPAPVLPLPGML